MFIQRLNMFVSINRCAWLDYDFNVDVYVNLDSNFISMIMSTKYLLISLKLLGILDFIKKKKENVYCAKKILSARFGWVGHVRGNKINL